MVGLAPDRMCFLVPWFLFSSLLLRGGGTAFARGLWDVFFFKKKKRERETLEKQPRKGKAGELGGKKCGVDLGCSRKGREEGKTGGGGEDWRTREKKKRSS
jgi:hypothetical protein